MRAGSRHEDPALAQIDTRSSWALRGEFAAGARHAGCTSGTRRGAVEPLTRAALGAIVEDEARHQRLGWSGLAALWPTLGEARRIEVQQEAARGLAGCEQQTARPAMQWLRSGQRFDPAYAALGVLHPEARVEAFYAAVERLVVPRLTRLGLDGQLAWKSRYQV